MIIIILFLIFFLGFLVILAKVGGKMNEDKFAQDINKSLGEFGLKAISISSINKPKEIKEENDSFFNRLSGTTPNSIFKRMEYLDKNGQIRHCFAKIKLLPLFGISITIYWPENL